jgi:hypothetical protein
MQYLAGRHAGPEVFAVLHEQGLPFSNSVWEGAAERGRLPVLNWLLTEQSCPLPKDICTYAVASGSIDVLRWLRKRGAEFAADTQRTAGTFCSAARARNKPMMEYLLDEGCPTSSQSTSEADDVGDYKFVRWLLEHGIPWRPNLTLAIDRGNMTIELLQWMLQQPGIEADAWTMRAAAEAGLLDVCKYLRAQGCPWEAHGRWSDNVLDTAALNGHAAVVRWLHESGAPISEWPFPCYHAAESGDIDTMSYLLSIGLRVSAGTLSRMLAAAGARGKLAAAQWLRQQGAAWPDEYLVYVDDNCAQNRSGEVLAWARAEGCTLPTVPSHLLFG